MSRFLPFFIDSAVFTVAVISPGDGDTVTTSEIPVSWTFSPGTQVDFQVEVFDSTGTVLVYDSGVILSATQSHTIPSGALENSTNYIIRVTVHTAAGQEGVSEDIDISTSWSLSADVSGIAIRIIGDRCDVGIDAADTLPGARISWSQIVPGGAETFTRYLIRRREAGSTTWVVVAEVTAVGTLTYFDPNIASGVRYEWGVTWEATVGGSLVESDVVSVFGTVEFDFTYLHSVSDPTVFVLLYSLDSRVDIEEDVGFVQVWGRRAPTAVISEADSARFRVNVLEELHRQPDMWDRIVALRNEQRENVATLMLRRGFASDRWFCNIDSSERRDGERAHRQRLDIRETHYTESIV